LDSCLKTGSLKKNQNITQGQLRDDKMAVQGLQISKTNYQKNIYVNVMTASFITDLGVLVIPLRLMPSALCHQKLEE
jgi:hypothetical protein